MLRRSVDVHYIGRNTNGRRTKKWVNVTSRLILLKICLNSETQEWILYMSASKQVYFNWLYKSITSSSIQVVYIYWFYAVLRLLILYKSTPIDWFYLYRINWDKLVYIQVSLIYCWFYTSLHLLILCNPTSISIYTSLLLIWFYNQL